ncbi:hypothetical protein [Okeania sp.]|uniref:hypothetical protein n=1 Tax=Okeania sp. TaxID=3100323 RepID=UPI002B4B2F78|nr:hypothetical protein [Okeania sp.]MEB3341506.1 hypothetical protein [Okeania sp.]
MAVDTQDVESLGWYFQEQEEKQTAFRVATFNLYQGAVCFDDQEIKVPVVVGDGILDILIGLSWLENRRLVVDRKAGILTLESFSD